MKNLYIADVLKKSERNKSIEVLGWVKSKREAKNVIFLDVIDSSGSIQAVVSKKDVSSKDYLRISKISVESAVKVSGAVILSSQKNKEIKVSSIEVIGKVTSSLTPNPRKDFDIFKSKYADLVLKKRHLYLRNKKLMAVMKFKSNFILETHKWFNEQGFVFIDAPVLTKLLLYDDESAFKLDYSDGEKMFLSQCNTFQLEAAVHAFEKVYNLTPSFRAEHSKSRRHLREYWHLKAEIAWADLDDMVQFAEKTFYNIAKNTVEKSEKEIETLDVRVDLNQIKPPYRRINYDEALKILHSRGNKLEWGKSLGADEEKIITHEFGEKLIFIQGIPCTAEAFPFCRDRKNPKTTRTCDLISPHGFGELFGTAEKIVDKKELLERMAEKNKTTSEQMKRYQWYVDLREYGCVPHAGMGMGVERVIRYLLKLPHVQFAVSFPRLYGRHPNP